VEREITVNTLENLVDLRLKHDLLKVLVYTKKLKQRGLLPYALRFGLWALSPNGILMVFDNGPDGCVAKPRTLPFNLVVETVVVFIRNLGVISAVDYKKRSITVVRTAPKSERKNWSAGIIFSGNPSEFPLLARCIEGLLLQPELAGGGEVVVCGSAQAEHLVTGQWPVKYLGYDEPSAPGNRFLVGKKKNYLIRHLKNDKCLICHSRIVLMPGALSRMPSEFDVITPAVHFMHGSREVSYLDFGVVDLIGPTMEARRAPIVAHYRKDQYLDLLDGGMPYVDGGIFCCSKRQFMECPLGEDIAWAEGEDVEWCRRMYISGKLIELAPGSKALSQTSKLTNRGMLVASLRQYYVFTILRMLKNASAFASHHAKRALGFR
jgi:hypothetical protein